MHEARPFGLFSPGQAGLTPSDVSNASVFARRVENLRHVYGLDSLTMVRDMPDGSRLVAVNAAGLRRLFVLHPDEEEEDDVEFAPSQILPMLYSGRIFGWQRVDRIYGEDGVARMPIHLTEQCRRRIANYGMEREWPVKPKAGRERSYHRFAIEYPSHLAELRTDNERIFQSQYNNATPCLYSGSLAAVQQVVSGFGKQANIPEDEAQEVLIVPSEFYTDIQRELSGIILPGYTGRPVENGEFQYDYKFNQCHGVTMSAGAEPWLVRVNSAGVYAMPLPMIPETRCQAFRAYMEAVGDDEILAVLDRFGGLPTGESIPTNNKDLQAWVRAGVAVKVCDVSAFYGAVSSYFPACGWAFPDHGREAANTGYRIEGNLCWGDTYVITLNIGAMRQHGYARLSLDKLGGEDAANVSAYVAAMLEAFTQLRPHERQAAAYKLYRSPAGELLTRARLYGESKRESERDMWHNKVADKIASVTGTLVRSATGRIGHFGFGQIKYPFPLPIDALVTFDPRGEMEGRPPEPVKADTIMYVYYVGDDLKFVRYFHDPRVGETETTIDSPGEERFVGEWTDYYGMSEFGISGMFYTSDIDERLDTPKQGKVVRTVGKDQGWGGLNYDFGIFFSMQGWMWQNRYYTHETETTTYGGFENTLGLAIPVGHRSAALHARKRSYVTRSITYGAEQKSVTGSTEYLIWTYDFVFHWLDSPWPPGAGAAIQWPKDSYPVWAEGVAAPGDSHGGYADNGNWLGLEFPTDVFELVSMVNGTHDFWNHGGYSAAPPYNPPIRLNKVEANVQEKLLNISVRPLPEKIHEQPTDWYFDVSPDKYGFFFRREVYSNKMGEKEYHWCSEEVPSGEGEPQMWHYGETTLCPTHESRPFFIGVINE